MSQWLVCVTVIEWEEARDSRHIAIGWIILHIAHFWNIWMSIYIVYDCHVQLCGLWTAEFLKASLTWICWVWYPHRIVLYTICTAVNGIPTHGVDRITFLRSLPMLKRCSALRMKVFKIMATPCSALASALEVRLRDRREYGEGKIRRKRARRNSYFIAHVGLCFTHFEHN